MIRITKNIVIKDKKLFKKARYIKRYLVTTVWFLFIPVFSSQKLLKNPSEEMPDIDNDNEYPTVETERRVYAPSQDENRKLEGKDEINFTD